jgi:hypothetical protein
LHPDKKFSRYLNLRHVEVLLNAVTSSSYSLHPGISTDLGFCGSLAGSVRFDANGQNNRKKGDVCGSVNRSSPRLPFAKRLYATDFNRW